jgi:hypothetical protein
MSLQYLKHEKVSLKGSPDFNEKWLQEIISQDPSILGLGELILKEMEKPLTYGRLDLLLKDDETDTRYEVEIQLGKVDESHIVRTLEYWDEERKSNRVHLRVTKDEIMKNEELFKELFSDAYKADSEN